MRPLNGEEFVTMILENGLSVKKVCDRAKLDNSAIGQWRKGKHNITLKTYVRLLDAYEELITIREAGKNNVKNS